jgi:hypothetical protein
LTAWKEKRERGVADGAATSRGGGILSEADIAATRRCECGARTHVQNQACDTKQST